MTLSSWTGQKLNIYRNCHLFWAVQTPFPTFPGCIIFSNLPNDSKRKAKEAGMSIQTNPIQSIKIRPCISRFWKSITWSGLRIFGYHFPAAIDWASFRGLNLSTKVWFIMVKLRKLSLEWVLMVFSLVYKRKDVRLFMYIPSIQNCQFRLDYTSTWTLLSVLYIIPYVKDILLDGPWLNGHAESGYRHA